jgi:hypothetical protein
VDAAAHLAMLVGNDQVVLGRALASGEIDTNDLRAVVQLRKAGESDEIRKIFNRVKRRKPAQEYVAEFQVRAELTRKAMLDAFRKYIPENEILRLELDGTLGRLVVTEKGKQALTSTARVLRVPLRRVIPDILRSSTGSHGPSKTRASGT